jgi:hypothetical protein
LSKNSTNSKNPKNIPKLFQNEPNFSMYLKIVYVCHRKKKTWIQKNKKNFLPRAHSRPSAKRRVAEGRLAGPRQSLTSGRALPRA